MFGPQSLVVFAYPLRENRVQPLRLPQVSPERDKIESSYTRLQTGSLRSEGERKLDDPRACHIPSCPYPCGHGTNTEKEAVIVIPSERQSYKFPPVALYSIIRYAFGPVDKRSFLDGCVDSCVILFQPLRLLARVLGWS